jgi:hypothetical protein
MTALTDSIYDAYAYDGSDTDKLIRQLNERFRATWINALQDLARVHGCNQYPPTPKGVDARYLRQLAERDATSISNTFNRELRTQIEKLYAANKKGNTRYYTSNLAKWQAKRDTWKVYQISLATDSAARQYAFTRFYAENPDIARMFVASGPPAVCKICMRLFAAGLVDYTFTQRNGFPAHINCPHLWKAAAPQKVECARLWVG